MGRPAKSLKEHKESGTFRADRHSGRAETEFGKGVPVMPKDCPRPDVWKSVVDNVPAECWSPPDGIALMNLCRMEYAIEKCFEKEEFATMVALTAKAIALYSRFGIDPRSRSGIKMPTQKTTPKTSGLAQLLAMREARKSG